MVYSYNKVDNKEKVQMMRRKAHTARLWYQVLRYVSDIIFHEQRVLHHFILYHTYVKWEKWWYYEK